MIDCSTSVLSGQVLQVDLINKDSLCLHTAYNPVGRNSPGALQVAQKALGELLLKRQ